MARTPAIIPPMPSTRRLTTPALAVDYIPAPGALGQAVSQLYDGIEKHLAAQITTAPQPPGYQAIRDRLFASTQYVAWVLQTGNTAETMDALLRFAAELRHAEDQATQTGSVQAALTAAQTALAAAQKRIQYLETRLAETKARY